MVTHRPGMSFIEVVLAVFILGSLLSSLMLLQSTALQSMWEFSSRAERIWLLKDELAQQLFRRIKKEEAHQRVPQQKKVQERAVQEPQTNILYEQKGVAKESTLATFKDIVIEKATARWQEWNAQKEETMITFLYKPEKKLA